MMLYALRFRLHDQLQRNVKPYRKKMNSFLFFVEDLKYFWFDSILDYRMIMKGMKYEIIKRDDDKHTKYKL